MLGLNLAQRKFVDDYCTSVILYHLLYLFTIFTTFTIFTWVYLLVPVSR